jgi:hypothetical protein
VSSREPAPRPRPAAEALPVNLRRRSGNRPSWFGQRDSRVTVTISKTPVPKMRRTAVELLASCGGTGFASRFGVKFRRADARSLCSSSAGTSHLCAWTSECCFAVHYTKREVESVRPRRAGVSTVSTCPASPGVQPSRDCQDFFADARNFRRSSVASASMSRSTSPIR